MEEESKPGVGDSRGGSPGDEADGLAAFEDLSSGSCKRRGRKARPALGGISVYPLTSNQGLELSACKAC